MNPKAMVLTDQDKGYLDALAPSQGCAVVLGGLRLWVPRAKLGRHLRLARIAKRITDSEERIPVLTVQGMCAEAIRAYMVEVGVDTSGATGTETLTAYLRLAQANSLQWSLPFMQGEAPPSKPPAYDYPERVYAWWVHKLASRYGWTRVEIMELWPEEVACYLQEITVAEYDEADERRALSELAYTYDKQAKKARFRPLPRPGWMIGLVPAKVRRVRRDMMPIGVIIDLSGKRDV